MTRLQFRVLYREFLFRLVDRDVLSVSAQGDASRLFGQIAAVLVLLSIPFTVPAIGIGNSRLSQQAKFISAWPAEHALIATTMLIVGLFAVLSWDAAYPDRHDAFVLGSLPVRASTIFAAKIAALAVALSVTVVVFNGPPGVLLPFALVPREATPLDLLVSLQFYRSLAAYWITIFAAGAFVLSCVLVLQGLTCQLPRRPFLRFSAILQLMAFCVFLAGYFLEPPLASHEAITAAANRQMLLWIPSYWFLGIFQQLSGSLTAPDGTVLVGLAMRAWISLGVVGFMAALLFLLSYFRTLRKIVEQPDIIPSARRLNWLPPFGNSLETAITQFSIRALVRSRRHRVLLSFYSGIGFAIVILFLRTPVAHQLATASVGDSWHQVSLPLLASSFVMMAAWVLGTRVVFAIPLELRANWIFRVTQVRSANNYFCGTRRTVYVMALAPVWCASALVFFSCWPWSQASEHLIVLVLVGISIAEIWLYGFQKIPFTCSYLPGKSNLHITFLLCLMLGLNGIFWGAEFERHALSDLKKYLCIVAVLAGTVIFAWMRRAGAGYERAELLFQDEMAPVITTLGL